MKATALFSLLLSRPPLLVLRLVPVFLCRRRRCCLRIERANGRE